MKVLAIAEFFSDLAKNVSRYMVYNPTRKNYIVNGDGIVISSNKDSAVANAHIPITGMQDTVILPDATSVGTLQTLADCHWFMLRKIPVGFTKVFLSRPTDYIKYGMDSAGDVIPVRVGQVSSIEATSRPNLQTLDGLEYGYISLAANILRERNTTRNFIPYCLSFASQAVRVNNAGGFVKANIYIKKVTGTTVSNLIKVLEVPRSSFKIKDLGNNKSHSFATIDKNTLYTAMPTDSSSNYYDHLYIELVFQNSTSWVGQIKMEEAFVPSDACHRPLNEYLNETRSFFTHRQVLTVDYKIDNNQTNLYSSAVTGCNMDYTPIFYPIAAWFTDAIQSTFTNTATLSDTQYFMKAVATGGEMIRFESRHDNLKSNLSKVEFRLVHPAILFNVPIN